MYEHRRAASEGERQERRASVRGKGGNRGQGGTELWPHDLLALATGKVGGMPCIGSAAAADKTRAPALAALLCPQAPRAAARRPPARRTRRQVARLPRPAAPRLAPGGRCGAGSPAS